MAEVKGFFLGEFTHSLDPKRRLTIPSEWREHAGPPSSLCVMPGVEQRCLLVFTAREMALRLQRVRSHSISDVKAQQFIRVFGSQSQLVPWDTAGRIRVKDELLGFAHLTDQVVLVGAINRIELWEPELWKTVSAAGIANLGEAAEHVGF